MRLDLQTVKKYYSYSHSKFHIISAPYITMGMHLIMHGFVGKSQGRYSHGTLSRRLM